MFPKTIRDRLYENAAVGINNKKDMSILNGEEGLIKDSAKSMPIADFYPDTTVSTAKIVAVYYSSRPLTALWHDGTDLLRGY